MSLFVKLIDTDIENNVWIPNGDVGGGMEWEVGIDVYMLLCIVYGLPWWLSW